MIADAKTAGWAIRKTALKRPDKDTTDLFGAAPRVAGGKADEPYTHTCPSCASPNRDGGLF